MVAVRIFASLIVAGSLIGCAAPPPVAELSSALMSCNGPGDCSPLVVGKCLSAICNADHTCGFQTTTCNNVGGACGDPATDCALGVADCSVPCDGSSPSRCNLTAMPTGIGCVCTSKTDCTATPSSCQNPQACTFGTCTFTAKRDANGLVAGCCNVTADCNANNPTATCQGSSNKCVCPTLGQHYCPNGCFTGTACCVDTDCGGGGGGVTCSDGTCSCGARTYCPTGASRCVDGNQCCTDSQCYGGSGACTDGTCGCKAGDTPCGAAVGGAGTCCPPRADAATSCNAVTRACEYNCDAGFHVCGTTCKSNTSVNTCGALCNPCPAGNECQDPACNNGVCGWVAKSASGCCDTKADCVPGPCQTVVACSANRCEFATTPRCGDVDMSVPNDLARGSSGSDSDAAVPTGPLSLTGGGGCRVVAGGDGGSAIAFVLTITLALWPRRRRYE
jgi:hypothetical protein